MTPNWLLPQMNWMPMPETQSKSVGQGVVEGAGAIGTALLKRRQAVPKPPPVQMPVQAPAVEEPAPVALQPPAYGAPPQENTLMKKKHDILSMMMGGAAY